MNGVCRLVAPAGRLGCEPFILGDESKDDEVYALRPMTCPFQFTIYNTQMHSYRDLPIRYNETSTLFRNESSGEMHGLIRVRQFTISEAHLICTPEQLAGEFRGVVDLVHFMTSTLGIQGDLTYRFSRRDPADKEKYIDDDEVWNNTEAVMKDILDSLGLDYKEAIGEAAFYGPKLDIQFKNVHGKEDTLITVQIDRYLAERLDMTYIDADGLKKRPYIIHRTSIGCYERTLATLIEKYAGAMPIWIAPEQIRILPISERHHEACAKVKEKLAAAGFRVTLDDRSEKVGYKIREAQLEKIPYMLVMGDKEAEDGTVSVRKRGEGDIGSHFPPSDPQWKAAPSRRFLEHAAGLVAARRGRIVNLDLTIVCEAPRIGPHAAAMKAAIAEVCGISPSRIAIKATTAEGLGFIGRGEGLTAYATATIEVPRET